MNVPARSLSISATRYRICSRGVPGTLGPSLLCLAAAERRRAGLCAVPTRPGRGRAVGGDRRIGAPDSERGKLRPM